MKNCTRCSKVTGVIRIVLGAAMLYFGFMKLSATPEMQAFIGGAAHKFGLTFLSETVWFWIATIGEIVAGLMLLFGYKTKIAAILTLIIMVFAFNATGWNVLENINALLVTIGSLILLYKGSGDWAVCPEGGCCNSGHCNTSGGGCCGGVCHSKGDTTVEEIVEVE